MNNLDYLLPHPAGDSMTMLWGTVTADGTAVLLDGDTVPLPTSTPSLVPLRANVRVAVDRYGKGLRIVGEVAPPVASPALIAAVALAMNPVGTIYFSVVNTNPGTLFGGTWVAWGSGRVPVGVDTAQTEFNTVEKTGGEKTHLLTPAETAVPQHAHLGVYAGYSNLAGTSLTNMVLGGASTYLNDQSQMAGRVGPTTTANASAAHNNLPPYVTCWMWKRTA